MAFQIGLLFLLKHKTTLFYLLSFAFIRFITCCHSLLLIFIFCYSLSFVVICCDLLYHSLSFVVSLVFIRCTTRCHSLSPVVIRCHWVSFVVTIVVIHCHSLSFDVARCTTRLSFYKRPLFYIFLLFTSSIVKARQKNTQLKVLGWWLPQNQIVLLHLVLQYFGAEGWRDGGRGPKGRGSKNTNTPIKQVFNSSNGWWLNV